MNGDGTLRDGVLEAIRAGKLPSRSPERVWGGQGSGACCAICGVRIEPEETELELEFSVGDEGSEQVDHHFHVSCFSAWDFARHKLELQPDAVTATGLSGAATEGTVSASEREAALKRAC